MRLVPDSENVALIITDAGMRALENDSDPGFNISFKYLGIGKGVWSPGPDATELKDLIKKVRITDYKKSPGELVLNCVITDDQIYDIHELGVYTKEGVLFAVGSSEDAVMRKGRLERLYLRYKLVMNRVDSERIEIIGTGERLNLDLDEALVQIADQISQRDARDVEFNRRLMELEARED